MGCPHTDRLAHNARQYSSTLTDDTEENKWRGEVVEDIETLMNKVKSIEKEYHDQWL